MSTQTTLPKLTEGDVRSITDSGSFSRGRSYYQEGAILNPRRQGMKLQAQAMGTELYRTEVTLNQHGIDSTKCSCPVGSQCKHVVALLLTYVHKPQSFSEVSETRKVLAARNQAQLIELILKMIDRHPELEAMVELPVVSEAATQTRIDPQLLLRQIRGGGASGRRRGRYDYDDYYSSDYEEAEPVVDTADQFAAAGDWENAVIAYATVAEELTENYEEYADHEGGLGDVLTRCVDGLTGCLDGMGIGANRQEALQALFDIYLWDVEQGGIGEGDGITETIVAATTADEKKEVAQWVKEVIPSFKHGHSDWGRQTLGHFLLSLQMDELDDEQYLAICRQTGRHGELIDRLLKLQRLEEAIRNAKSLPVYDLLALDTIFQNHQQTVRYENLVYEAWQTSKDYRLAEWLKESAKKAGNRARQLQFAEILYSERPSLEMYREIKRLAAGDGWQSLRSKLRQQASAKGVGDLMIRIWLEDGEVEEAIGAVKNLKAGGWSGYDTPIQADVAEAAKESHPQDAIAIYTKLAEGQIAQRSRQNYAVAASYLNQAKRIHQKIGANNEWQQLLNRIRSQYNNLPALRDEMNKAKL